MKPAHLPVGLAPSGPDAPVRTLPTTERRNDNAVIDAELRTDGARPVAEVRSINTDAPRVAYSVEEVAAILGISLSCAYDCIRRGELPSVRLGRRIVIPVAALTALLDQTTSRPSNARR